MKKPTAVANETVYKEKPAAVKEVRILKVDPYVSSYSSPDPATNFETMNLNFHNYLLCRITCLFIFLVKYAKID